MTYKETYNSQNPNLEFVFENGWYELREKGKEKGLAVCFSSEMNSWGYWDWDPKTDKKEWVVIDVPEKNPSLVHRAVPYTEEEQRQADEVIASLTPVFAFYTKMIPGNKGNR